MASDKAASAGGSVGQQAFSLLRALIINGLLVAIPIAGYYFAVVEQQSRARTELGLDALKRIQQEFDTRIVRLDTLLRSPNLDGNGGKAYENERYSDLGAWVDDSTAISCADNKAIKPISRFMIDERAGRSTLHGVRCDGTRLAKHLDITVASLLEARSSLAVFEKVDLVSSSGNVLASAEARAARDPDRLAHPEVSSALSPTSLKTFLVEAVRKRQQELSGPGENGDSKAPVAEPGEPTVLRTTLSDRRYRIYLLPFRAEEPLLATATDAGQPGTPVVMLYLVGIQPVSALDEASAALGVNGLWYLTLAVLLMMAAWPLLRVLLLSDHEAVSRPSLAATVISLLFVPALLVIAMLAHGARGQTLYDWDQRANVYAADIDRELRAEVASLLVEINRLAPLYRIDDEGAAGVRSTTPKLPAGQTLPQPLQCRGTQLAPLEEGDGKACRIKSASYCHLPPEPGSGADGLRPFALLDSAFYADEAGRLAEYAHLTANGCQDRVKEIRLGSREYFKTLQRDSGWPLPAGLPGVEPGTALGDARHYVAQRIFSRADGSRTLLVAIPRRDQAGQFDGIFAATSAMRALAAAVRPPLLGFAVIDTRTGTVVFHSNDDNSLQENFFSETGNDPELLAVFRSGRREVVDLRYRGIDHRLAVRPVEGMPWTVVSFYEVDQATRPVYSAAIMSAIAYIAFILIVAIGVAAVIVLVVMYGTRGRWQPLPWQWLWPQWRLRRSYLRIAMAMAALVLAEVLFWASLPTEAMLKLLAASVAIACGAAALLLVPRRQTATNTGASRAGLRGRWLDPPDAPSTSVDTLAEFRGVYLVCVLLGIIAIGAVPAGGLFFHAWPWMNEATLRVGLADSAASFEQRIARITNDQRRVALPQMELVGRLAPAPQRALQEAAPGFVRLPDGAGLELRWSGPAPAAAADPGACRSRYTRPSPTVLELWSGLARLLPQQQDARRSLLDDGAVQRQADDGCLRYQGVGSDEGRIEFVYRQPILGYAVRDLLGGSRSADDKADDRADDRAGTLISDDDPRLSLLSGGTLVLALFGLTIGLVLLVEIRVLGINVPFSPPTTSLGAEYDQLADVVQHLAPVSAQWWYLLRRPDGRVPTPANIRDWFAPPYHHQVIDLGRPGADLAAITNTAPALLLNFSRAALNPATRPELLKLLERLIAARPETLLLTSMTPPWPRLCQPQDFPDLGDLPEPAEAIRWRAVQARFTTHHLPEPVAAPHTRTAEEPAATVDTQLARQLEDEQLAFSDVLGWKIPTFQGSWSREPARDLKDFEDLALVFAEAQLRREWAYCTVAERLTLHQMARGLVPNPLNRRVLDDLLLRRLAVLAPEPQIASSTLRRFVLNAETPEQYARWGAQRGAGAWSVIRVPFFILLMLLVAWFAYSFGELFTTVNSVLLGTLGILGTIGKASSFVTGSGNPDK